MGKQQVKNYLLLPFFDGSFAELMYAYYNYSYSAELELDNRKGTSDVYISNGGLMCNFKVKDNGIEFYDAPPIFQCGRRQKYFLGKRKNDW